jgi:hypothetical protein
MPPTQHTAAMPQVAQLTPGQMPPAQAPAQPHSMQAAPQPQSMQLPPQQQATQPPGTMQGLPPPTPPIVVDDPSARPSYGSPSQLAPPMSGPNVGLIIGIVLVVFVVLGVGGFVALKLTRSGPKPTPDLAPSASVSITIPSTTTTAPPTATESEAPSASAADTTTPTPPDTAPTTTAATTTTATPTSTTTATTTPTTTPTTTATAHPSAHPSATPVDPNAFNAQAAKSKLDTYAGIAEGVCHDANGLSGGGTAHVTFGPDGKVQSVALDAPYAGTKQGTCVSGFLQRAVAPSFVGAPATVTYKFSVAK